MEVASILSLVALSFWILVLCDRKRAWPTGQVLRRYRIAGDGPAGAAGPIPEVVAIVPARDEAEVLRETLPALLAQDHPAFRIVLVDDRSGDGTAAAAREIAAAAGRPDRLQVQEGAPPPPGWTGKVHALQKGLEAVRASSTGGGPEWILLTDADIRHPVDSVSALLATAAAEGKDMVSIMARLRAENFWERLLIPPFVFFFQLLYPFRRASDPRSGIAAAAGGCILVRRRVLEAAGAFPSIAGAIIDDVALAREVRRAGGRTWLGLDPGLASIRAYPGLADIWRMVSRSAFFQLRHSYLLLALTTAALLEFLAAPPALFLACIIGANPIGAAASLGAWLIPAALLHPSVRHHRVPAAYALALPAAGLLYLLMTLSSAWEHFRGRGPAWRGRRYGAAGGSGETP